jgi:hypothetical protein
MTIDKAIQILRLAEVGAYSGPKSDLASAIKLGIDALKRCRVLAQESKLWALQPLPGETKE